MEALKRFNTDLLIIRHDLSFGPPYTLETPVRQLVMQQQYMALLLAGICTR